jgi:hypothetical protein
LFIAGINVVDGYYRTECRADYGLVEAAVDAASGHVGDAAGKSLGDALR